MVVRPERRSRVRHDGKFSTYVETVERIKSSGATLTIHHDLCSCELSHAMEFAAAETREGIRATYLPLHTDAMWRHPRFLNCMRSLVEADHHLGLHHDAIGVWLRNLTPPAETLKTALAQLRLAGSVEVAAAHGAPTCYDANGRLRYVNYEVWQECQPEQNVVAAAAWKFDRVPLADLGLKERYFGDQTHYVSDSGGAWRGWSGDPRPRPFERVGGAMLDGLGVLDDVGPQSRVMLLAHPCWWRVP